MTRHGRALRWGVWLTALAALTYGLLSPQAPEVGKRLFETRTAFVLSKSVHVGAYAFLAALAGWLPVGWRTLAGLWLLLVAHGAVTEFLQFAMDVGRVGSAIDVLYDAVGVMLGAALVALLCWLFRPAAVATGTATAPPRPR